MNEAEVKNAIRQALGNGSHKFKQRGISVIVSQILNISVSIKGINSDNPELENYEFQGSATLSVPNENGTVLQPYQIAGYAKVEDTIPIRVQIKSPISII